MVSPKLRADDELAQDVVLLCALGHPEALPPPPHELRAEVDGAIGSFRAINAPISEMDRVCLAIARLALDRLPDGYIIDHATRAVRTALALFAWTASEVLVSVGLASKEEFAVVQRDKSASLDVGVARSIRYRAWFAEVLAMRKPRDERDEAVQELFIGMLPLPNRNRIVAVLRHAARLVADYHRRRTGYSLIENADDLAAEMWEAGPRSALRLCRGQGGSAELKYDAFRVRDAFRGRQWGAAAPSPTVNRDLVRQLHEVAPVEARRKPVSMQRESREHQVREWEPAAATVPPDLVAMAAEREVRVARALRELRAAYGEDPKAVAALRYTLGKLNYEPAISREAVASLFAVSPDAIRAHEPRVSRDLKERLRGIA